MEKITSAKNPLIRKIIQASTKQSFRNKNNLTIIEGVHLAKDFLDKIGNPEVCLISETSKSCEVQDIISNCISRDVRIIELPENLFSKISPVIDGVGIIFLIKIPKNDEVNLNEETLILEDIQDPGNLGTILRSAVAFGVNQVICSKGTASVWSPKVLRSGMGAHFELSIVENLDLKTIIPIMKIPVLTTSLDAKKSIYEEDLSYKKAWVFGNEGRGVSPDIQKLSSKKVIIPQSAKIESLNVAMATTICLSESWRQKMEKNR